MEMTERNWKDIVLQETLFFTRSVEIDRPLTLSRPLDVPVRRK